MQVQVEHSLACAATGVDNGAVASFELSFPREVGRDNGHGTEHCFVLCTRFRQRCKMLFRANQNMRGRLRVDVLEGENVGVLINHFGWNLFCRNFTEQAVGAHGSPSQATSSSRITSVVWNPSRIFNSSANFWAFCSPEIFPVRTR